MQGHLNDPSSLTVSTISNYAEFEQKDGTLSTALFSNPVDIVIDNTGQMFVLNQVRNGFVNGGLSPQKETLPLFQQ